MAKHNRWVPLVQSEWCKPLTDADIDEACAKTGLDRAKVIEELESERKRCSYWVNDVYQVQVREMDRGMVHLNIRRRDGKVILRDWRHFQRIKNQLLGPECEAMELYPAESRLVDESNKYHLFGTRDPTFRFPVDCSDGKRHVNMQDSTKPGYRQRPGAIEHPREGDRT